MAHSILINRLFEIQDTNFEVVDVQPRNNQIMELKVQHKPTAYYICSRCGHRHFAAYDFKTIILKDIPIGHLKTRLKVKRARVLCSCHHSPIVEKIPFRSSCSRLTKRMQEYCEGLLCTKMFTVADVARLLELDYGLVYKIDHRILLELVQKLEIPTIKRLGVDEKSFLKGQKYVTVFNCLDRGKAVWVANGRGQEAIDEFFKILGSERTKDIELVCRDEHKPYIKALTRHVPHALQISDKFHVVKHLNEAIDQVRREEGIKAKGLLWTLRKRAQNHNGGNRKTLTQLKEDNNFLFEIYLLKEKFFEFFDFKRHQTDEARVFMAGWIHAIASYGLGPSNNFIDYLQRHFYSILNIIKEGFTNATSEGINRKINVLKSMAYGYKNIHYFKLKILQRCGLLGSLYKNFTHSKS